MKEELDKLLCEKYPKIFRDRYGNVQTTAMCWGFEHSDGWFSIIDKACSNIQWHIDNTRKSRLRALRVNRALATGDTVKIAKALSNTKNPSQWFLDEAKSALVKSKKQIVPDSCPQVVAVQVKEKFGTLRFYYNGGDDYVKGVMDMAESMSGVTCEQCGAPGKSNDSGWIRTTCETHKHNE